MMYGTQITRPSDMLHKISIEQIVKLIKSEQSELYTKVQELRRIRQIDEQSYRNLKIQLPYFTVASYSPPFRKSENVSYAEYIVIDIDHLAQTELNIDNLKENINAMPHTLCSFVSPSNDGLKVIFRLNERIYDKSIYKTFYKIFALRFSSYFKLEQNIDIQTCDITRVSFLSHDKNIYYNSAAQSVNVKEYIDTENTLIYNEITKEIRQYEKENKPDKEQKVLSDDVLIKIKQKLNPQYRPPQKHIFVPNELNNILPSIIKYIEEAGLKVDEVQNIHYGKKIKVSLGLRWAEVNIFYGKKGFSVVKTPKNGSDGELCNLLSDYIRQYLEV